MTQTKLTFPAERRLRDKLHFETVFKTGTRHRSAYYHVIVAPAVKEIGKIAIACPKKVGKANIRNHCKRRLKEAIRIHLSNTPTSHDLIFLANAQCKTVPFELLCDTIQGTLNSISA